MATTATSAGSFEIGGDLEVTRLGFGAMRITGKGIWGPPEAHDRASHDLHAILVCARLATEAALRREESRGAHYREDFPETS